MFPGKIDGQHRKNDEPEIAWIIIFRIWERLNFTIAPSLREYHSMAYDHKHKTVIFFGGGGREESGYDNPNDVWLFENRKWKLVSNYK